MQIQKWLFLNLNFESQIPKLFFLLVLMNSFTFAVIFQKTWWWIGDDAFLVTTPQWSLLLNPCRTSNNKTWFLSILAKHDNNSFIFLLKFIFYFTIFRGLWWNSRKTYASLTTCDIYALHFCFTIFQSLGWNSRRILFGFEIYYAPFYWWILFTIFIINEYAYILLKEILIVCDCQLRNI